MIFVVEREADHWEQRVSCDVDSRDDSLAGHRQHDDDRHVRPAWPGETYPQRRHIERSTSRKPRGRPRDAEPSKDALRKRAERAAAEAADPEYRAKRATAAKAARERKFLLAAGSAGVAGKTA